MGPHEGQASLYPWRWYYSATGLLVWLVLVAVAVWPKANRDRRIVLTLIPLALVNLLYLLFKRLSGATSSSTVQFDLVFQSLIAAVTLLWLVAPVLTGRGLARIGVALVLVVAVAGLSVFSFLGTTSSEETLVLLGGLGAVLILAPTIATRRCGGRYRPVALTLWLALGAVLGGMAATVGFMVVIFLFFSSPPDASELLVVTLMTTLVGAVFGLCLFVLYLPYLLLGFVNPFFRERLQACLNLESTVESEEKRS